MGAIDALGVTADTVRRNPILIAGALVDVAMYLVAFFFVGWFTTLVGQTYYVSFVRNAAGAA